MQDLPDKLEKWVKNDLLDTLPIALAAIDRDSGLVYANPAFEQKFGEWRNRKYNQVYLKQGLNTTQIPEAFAQGKKRIVDGFGYDLAGRVVHYTKYTIPISDEGRIPYVIEMFTDMTETEQIRKEYQLLFDQVPCSVLIIDRELRILKSNRRLQEMIGDPEGAYCYRALKGLDRKCAECTASLTFKDGLLHTGHHEWRARDGKTVHLHVITVPLRYEDGKFDSIMELAVDVSKTIKLEDGLRFAHNFLDTMISTAMDGIFAVNEKGKVTLFNPAARKLLGVKSDQVVSREEIASMLPKGFLARISDARKQVYLPETEIKTLQNEVVPIRLVGTPISVNENSLGMAFSIQDLRVLKTLEREKLEAERMAAVGQTVAGLAHGIKNLVIALEGGLYMLDTGLNKGDVERIQQGLKMLSRNIHRMSNFVKAFLDFAKRRQIQATLNDPAEIAGEVVEMYAAKAAELGIELTGETQPDVQPAPIDYESMHECLTNLVGNALDACRSAGNERGRHVKVKTSEEDGAIIFEIADDGAGMDYEVKKKIFSTVFTTKGLDGTGLGLLMTQKIVQEHGGKISMHSEPGKGTIFRIILPRLRLPKITE